MSIVQTTSSNFKQEVLDFKGKVLVDFWAPWCGPCQMLSPVLEEIAMDNSGVKVIKVNVDEEPQVAAQYNVTAIPTVVIFENGQVKSTIVGFRQKQEYLAALMAK